MEGCQNQNLNFRSQIILGFLLTNPCKELEIEPYFYCNPGLCKEIGSFGQFKFDLRVELLGRYTFETD